MANDIVQNSRDWLSSPRTHASVWGDPESGHRCGAFHSSACANRGVDRRPRLDEYCVHPQFKAMRTDPLPLYGPLLSRDDRAGAHVCFGYHFRQLLCMAYIGGSHSWRKYDRLVGHRKGVGKILVEPSMQVPAARSLRATVGAIVGAPDRTVKSRRAAGPGGSVIDMPCAACASGGRNAAFDSMEVFGWSY